MNAILAAAVIFVVFTIGDMISAKTKAIVSMLLVASVVFLAGFWTGIFPTTMFADSTLLSMATSLNILGAVVIGGAKSLWGTTFGVFIIYGLQSTLLSKIPFFVENPAFITMITGLLIILIVMFFPGGIAQMMGNLMQKRKTAKFAANTQRRVDGYGQN